MKSVLKILFVLIYLLLCLWAFSYTIDTTPLTWSDFLVAMFAFGGAIYWAEFGVDHIFKLKDWIKFKIKKNSKCG